MAIRDITLGQYYPGESPVHRLDARTKILGALVFLISLFFVKSFTGFAFAALCLAVVIRVSRVPFSFITRGMKPLLLIIVFTMVLNLFTVPGDPLVRIGPLSITLEGIHRAIFMGVRLVLLIFGSSMLTLVTKPIQLTDGIEFFLSPFRRIGLPAHELAMMMSIALRFIPTLLEETDKIMKAQTARGADFESGNFIQRAKNLVPLLVPLFVSAFRIAGDLAMAMEARCYQGGEGRTRMNAMKFGKNDAGAFLLLALYVGLILFFRRLPLW